MAAELFPEIHRGVIELQKHGPLLCDETYP